MMLSTQIFVCFFTVFIASATPLLIRLDDEQTTKHLENPETFSQSENINAKANTVVKEVNENVDSSGPRNHYFGSPFNGFSVIRNGVKKMYRGIEIPIRKIYNGNVAGVAYIGDDDVGDNVSDRIDNVETKVDILSQELNNIKTLAGLYFFVRIFSGLLFNFI